MIVEADDLRQHLVGKHRLAPQLLLGHELKKHAARDVVATALVDNSHVLAGRDQLAHIVLVDVSARLGIVKAPVRVLANDSWF